MSSLPEKIKSLHFLVTDDYESMRVMITDHLKQLGVSKISLANCGNDAEKMIKEKHGTPDQIQYLLTDLIMENGTGLELVKAVRADERFKSLPIVMITSKADVGLVIECVKAGVNSYIVKPWELNDLAKKLTDSYKG